ncbi:hypothetical protein [Embleya hyalina]|uniref:hypothetical protein n=1 Tax=Embleya hyalina TaxID=516124 RepID=UPI000F849887|nr:hypothetical protein [Embleya hyalina]
MAHEIHRSWRRPQQVVDEIPDHVSELAQRIADATFVYEPFGAFGAVVPHAREAARWGDTDGAWGAA